MGEENINTDNTEVTEQQEVIPEQTENTENVADGEQQLEQQQEKTPEKTFTQNELDKHIQNRLSRQQRKLEEKYNPYVSFLDGLAKQYDMSVDEYVQAIQKQQDEARKQEYKDKGVDPDIVSKLVSENPNVKWAKQYKEEQEKKAKFEAEAKELFDAYPDLKTDDITEKIWQVHDQKGISLLDAYNRISKPDVKQIKEQAIKEYIEKCKKNNKPVEAGGATAPIPSKIPKTFEEARKQALEVLNQQNL